MIMFTGVIVTLAVYHCNVKVTDSQCISFSEYDQFFELLKSLYRRRNAASTWHKYALLQTVHFLKDLTLSGSSKKEEINLYAGHDISIEAILLTLDCPLDHHVPFRRDSFLKSGPKMVKN